jgi:hypothetical protein
MKVTRLLSSRNSIDTISNTKVLGIVIDKVVACHEEMSFMDFNGTSNSIVELVSNRSLSVSCVVEIDR